MHSLVRERGEWAQEVLRMIRVKELYKEYRGAGAAVQVLRGVSMEVMRGEFAAIIGPSGSGKSTLMNVLGCLDTADSGQYLLDGEEVTHLDSDGLAHVRGHKIGFVFQNFNLLPRLTAAENVALPLMYRGIAAKERAEWAEAALEKVGLFHRKAHLPAQMSGGQQQRTAIARALVTQPPLLLADEPTGNLDSASGEEVLCLMHKLHQQGTTILLITHDNGVAAQCSRRMEMRDGILQSVE